MRSEWPGLQAPAPYSFFVWHVHHPKPMCTMCNGHYGHLPQAHTKEYICQHVRRFNINYNPQTDSNDQSEFIGRRDDTLPHGFLVYEIRLI